LRLKACANPEEVFAMSRENAFHIATIAIDPLLPLLVEMPLYGLKTKTTKTI
jgi:hypothetical protein